MELNEWAPPERVAEWMVDATGRILATVGDLADDDDERWMCPYLPIVNPPIWEVGHVAWFAEWFVLRQLHRHEPLLSDPDARYDSGAVPHRTRWHLDFPDPATTRDYLRRVGDGVAAVVLDDRGLDSTLHFAAYAITHHDAHAEALMYTRQTLGWSPPPSVCGHTGGSNGPGRAACDEGRETAIEHERPTGGLFVDDDRAAQHSAAHGALVVEGDRRVGGGRLLLGASRRQPFVLDNERWAHAVDIEPFDLAVTPVTMTQFTEFVDAGGYTNPAIWSPGGWAWRQQVDASQPLYWRRGTDGWEHRRFDTWEPIVESGDHPMVHVSWWEAEAFCNWAGRRLPTEAEWEMATTTGPDGVKQWWFPWGDRDPAPGEAALDALQLGTVPVGAYAAGDGPWGHRQLIGNVWEWTASTFEPYPHFEPDAYRDNSEPWFGSRKVLRGGSWATRNRYVRSTFRNYFTPDRRDVFAGFRTAARRPDGV